MGAEGYGALERSGAEAAAQWKEPREAGQDRIHAADRRSCCFAIAGQLPLGQMHGATHNLGITLISYILVLLVRIIFIYMLMIGGYIKDPVYALHVIIYAFQDGRVAG